MATTGIEEKFRLFDFKQEKVRVLHYTWIAFFLTFFVWFNLAPVLVEMMDQFEWLTKDNVKTLIICNVALTIPARIIVGALIDKYGPRIVFSGLMVITTVPGLMFAFGDSLTQLVISRLLLGTIGAGFVIGIKMTANWFPKKHIGRAEGFYAGWGNFGSAAASMLIAVIAFNFIGGDNGWRYALAISSIVCGVYGLIYFFLVKDYEEGKEPHRSTKKGGPMPVSSTFELVQYCFWNIPLYGALGLLTYNLHKQVLVTGEPLLSWNAVYITWAILGIFYLFSIARIIKFNLPRIKKGVPENEKWHFSSVGALNTTYFANFGAELAVVSMLPLFFYEVFSSLTNSSGDPIMTKTLAGGVAASFAFINLIARPLGGYFSDKGGSRKKTMLVYMLGISLGFACMGFIAKYGPMIDGVETLVPMFSGIWWLVVAVIITMACSMFVQGAEGATFAMIPSIKKEMTGRIAGMAGAYGNVGAVTYLFIMTFVDYKLFFFILASGAMISFIYCAFVLKEPKHAFDDDENGAIMEIGEDEEDVAEVVEQQTLV